VGRRCLRLHASHPRRLSLRNTRISPRTLLTCPLHHAGERTGASAHASSNRRGTLPKALPLGSGRMGLVSGGRREDLWLLSVAFLWLLESRSPVPLPGQPVRCLHVNNRHEQAWQGLRGCRMAAAGVPRAAANSPTEKVEEPGVALLWSCSRDLPGR
jgi:hypothetical protein